MSSKPEAWSQVPADLKLKPTWVSLKMITSHTHWTAFDGHFLLVVPGWKLCMWRTAGRHSVKPKRWSTAPLEMVEDTFTTMGLSGHTCGPFKALRKKAAQGSVP